MERIILFMKSFHCTKPFIIKAFRSKFPRTLKFSFSSFYFFSVSMHKCFAQCSRVREILVLLVVCDLELYSSLLG